MKSLIGRGLSRPSNGAVALLGRVFWGLTMQIEGKGAESISFREIT